MIMQFVFLWILSIDSEMGWVNLEVTQGNLYHHLTATV